eukprot:TRINITY_DN16686_c0_g1_i1.p1 TRINITY_DN16686_c0_g1~~TRINITY_DN16686_c0_g1_i1.p1  ORF type:complete len:588 (+),score=77.62 TRINITY_DN16686_c0_g1_i1:71-1834(+)
MFSAVSVLCCLSLAASCDEREAEGQVLKQLMDGYDPGRLPRRPTEVALSATVAKVNQIMTSEQTVHLNMFMRHVWVDERLAWNESENCGVKMVVLMKDQKIWRPDTFFANSNEIRSPDGEEYTKVWSDGLVLWSKRMVLTIFCDMSFRRFPFDSQTCVSSLESYGYPTKDLTYRILQPEEYSNRSEIPSGIQMTHPTAMVGAYTLEMPTARVVKPAEYSGVAFSKVEITYEFKRNRSRYSLSMFIPLLLVVSISFVGLWVDPASVPARAMMSVTTQLVLISLMYILTKELPTTAYLTSLDHYFIICFFFLFFNTCEYALVNYLTTRCTMLEADINKRRAMRSKVRGTQSGAELQVPSDKKRKKKQLAELEEIFTLYDHMGTGSISTQDLGAVFLSFAEDRGCELSLSTIKQWVTLCDADKSGTIEFDELCTFAASHLQSFMNMEESRSLLFLERFPVTRRTISLIEKRYRVVSPCAFVLCTVVWLAFSLPRNPTEKWICIVASIVTGILVLLVCYSLLEPIEWYKMRMATRSIHRQLKQAPSFQNLEEPLNSRDNTEWTSSVHSCPLRDLKCNDCEMTNVKTDSRSL